jgi:hypothetical protein
MNALAFTCWACLVFLLHFAQTNMFRGEIPLDCSLLLIAMALRRNSLSRALIYAFLLSFSLDLVFLTQHIKGLSCMALLPLVYLGGQIRQLMIPAFVELSLFLYFILFFLLYHAIRIGLGSLLGLPIEPVPFMRLVYLDLWHTLAFGAVLLLTLRYGKVPP